MTFLPNCTIKIYKSSDTVNPVWIGTTDEYGRAIDIYGQPPNLRYGEYIAVAEHCDYNTEETIPFTVPETTVIPMSIGCTSSISTHETNYDHTRIGLSMLPSGVGPLPYIGTTAPPGFLLCDGSAISRSVYAGLFAVIGTSCGAGDGITTFNIPNMKGRVPVGIGASGVATLGGIGGEQTHTNTIAEMPAHTHTWRSTYDPGGGSYPVGNGVGNLIQSTGSAGSDAAHNNMQPYLGVNYIISI